MWNLFTAGSLQCCNDSIIASLEASQNRPKIKKLCKYINQSNFYILCILKFKTIILICLDTITSKLHKPSVGRDLKIFVLV